MTWAISPQPITPTLTLPGMELSLRVFVLWNVPKY
jgi:hypothetical protein